MELQIVSKGGTADVAIAHLRIYKGIDGKPWISLGVSRGPGSPGIYDLFNMRARDAIALDGIVGRDEQLRDVISL